VIQFMVHFPGALNPIL